MNAKAQKNPHFFTGNYASLREEHDIAALEIEGTLPPELEGSLYRVGPNPQYTPRDDDYHWFSGDGRVHAFHIGAGKVSYRNRWARTPKWQLEHEAGRALFGTFGNPATSDPLAQGRNGGTANTSMLWHGDRLFALEESHQPFEFDPCTLASKGHQSFGDRVTSRCTAHPKIDPESGELHFFAYSPDGPCSPSMPWAFPLDPSRSPACRTACHSGSTATGGPACNAVRDAIRAVPSRAPNLQCRTPDRPRESTES